MIGVTFGSLQPRVYTLYMRQAGFEDLMALLQCPPRGRVRGSPVKERGYAIHFESQTLNPLYTEPVYTCTCNNMLHVDELYLIVKAAWSDFSLSKFYVRCKTVVLFRKCI